MRRRGTRCSNTAARRYLLVPHQTNCPAVPADRNSRTPIRERSLSRRIENLGLQIRKQVRDDVVDGEYPEAEPNQPHVPRNAIADIGMEAVLRHSRIWIELIRFVSR